MVAIVVTTEGFEQVFALTDRLANPQWDQLLRTIGATIEEQTINHFNQQGGPEGPWAPTKRGGAILVLTGRLRGSIGFAVAGDQVAIGTNVYYGKFHQTGTRYMPRRMFLGTTETDKAELQAVVEDFIQRVITG